MIVPVALAHDYATQRGGAERVALWLAQAFPDAPMYTTLYDPEGTFPEFGALDLRTTGLNRVGVFQRHHRLALPLLAPAVSAQRVQAEVLLTSSTGWAHGYRGAERTVVYCHAPARWLYQRSRYLSGREGAGLANHARRTLASGALTALTPALRRWDRRAAHRADVYLANSTVTARAIREAYGIEAEVLPPPPAMLPDGEAEPVADLDPGFLLCVARLLPYKNVDVLIEAMGLLPGQTLAIVGNGPDGTRLQAMADQVNASSAGRVVLLGRVEDSELRWLYEHTGALVAASFEDYGLSPLEAGAFGKPSVVLGDGGYLDTVVEGVTGAFFATPSAEEIAATVTYAAARSWDTEAIRAHVAGFGLDRFVSRLRTVTLECGNSSGAERPRAA